MATVGFYLDTRREKKDGTFPIKLQVRHKGQIMLCTDFCATPETWMGTEYNKSAKNYKAKNVAIRNLINRVEMLLVILDDNQKLKGMSDKALKEYILKSIKNESTCKTFVSYIDEFIATKSKENTIVLYKATKNKILAYDPTCTFETMTRKWLESFNKWLKDTGIKTNSISIHLRNIRAVFNHAIDNEETELYPFRKFTIEREETRKRSLKPEQLITLRDLDLFNLKQIVDGRIEYKREKTGKLYSIKVEPEAIEILNRYKGNKFLLNTLEVNDYNYRKYMAAMNRGLQKLGKFERKGLGGKKIRDILFPGITSYWARHTWATIAHKIGISKDVISLALGHEFGCKTTGIYIDYDLEQIDKANRKVIDYINSLSL
ncbi:MAG: recombinase [Bacteroides finegoldii]|nr:MAG: recombinase [Bacteroides finegoldii]